jgi:hypothetical protein
VLIGGIDGGFVEKLGCDSAAGVHESTVPGQSAQALTTRTAAQWRSSEPSRTQRPTRHPVRRRGKPLYSFIVHSTQLKQDSDWSDEERVKEERFSFLADMMGVGGPSFDEEDDLLASNDDEDLQKDPISLIDLHVRFSSSGECGINHTDDSWQAHITSFLRESAARDADGFGALAGQLSAEEMIVVQRALQQGQS